MSTLKTKLENVQISPVLEEVGDFFIVPNNAISATKFGSFKWEYIYWRKNIIESNMNMKLPCGGEELAASADKDPLIQVWIVTEDSRDLGSHGQVFKDKFGNEHYIKIKEYIPHSLIKDVKEGDTITLNIPVEVYVNGYNSDTAEYKYPATIKFHLTASQAKYRYRNFGKFEKALKIVTKTFSDEKPSQYGVPNGVPISKETLHDLSDVYDRFFGDIMQKTEGIGK